MLHNINSMMTTDLLIVANSHPHTTRPLRPSFILMNVRFNDCSSNALSYSNLVNPTCSNSEVHDPPSCWWLSSHLFSEPIGTLRTISLYLLWPSPHHTICQHTCTQWLPPDDSTTSTSLESQCKLYHPPPNTLIPLTYTTPCTIYKSHTWVPSA
jgi:hypothetical protein